MISLFGVESGSDAVTIYIIPLCCPILTCFFIMITGKDSIFICDIPSAVRLAGGIQSSSNNHYSKENQNGNVFKIFFHNVRVIGCYLTKFI